MEKTLLQHGAMIFWLAGWCAIQAGIGRLCLSATSIRFASRSEGTFLASGIGLTISGYAVFILGATRSLDSLRIWILLIVLTILSIAGWCRSLQGFPTAPAESSASPWERAAKVLLGILLFAALLLVLTPEAGKDALIYHLAVPKLYLLHQGFYSIPGNIFADYPLLAEMHYLLALFLQNDLLAKAMNFAVLCGLLLGTALFARFLLKEHAFPFLSLLIFLSIPSVFAVSHVAYSDFFVAFFTLAATYSFFRWSEQGTTAWLILSGIFAGSAAACKYTALLLTPLCGLGILWIALHRREEAPRTLRLLLLFAAAALIAGCPFYIKNWMTTGNPFHPFLYGIFGGRGWDADQARLYDLFVQNLGMGRSLLDYLLIPWNVSLRAKMDNPQFDGILGPIFLMTLPFLAGLRRLELPVRMMLIYLFLSFLFWASSAQQIRYLIPLFPLLALITGVILTRYRSRRGIFALLLCIITASLAFNGYHIFRDFIKISPMRVAAGIESRDAFLSRVLPHYPMYLFVNRTLPPDARVFLIYMKNYTFLCERDCYSDSMFEAHSLQKILRDEATVEGVRNRLAAMGFTHLLYDAVFLLGDPSPLSAEQKNLFRDFRNRYLHVIRTEGTFELYRLHLPGEINEAQPIPGGQPHFPAN
ncbi:MAG: glycosyltransferase family 39 protein [Deltaproteobacteria bacterium]|nr:glycosyltransferase family 39 protein [Deltaproteobacteria bacterium]